MYISSTAVVSCSSKWQTKNIFQKRIVGGKVADIREHPWLLSFRENNIHRCGSSLIKPDTALTAGHCYDHAIPVQNYSIYGGSTYRKLNGEMVQVSNIYVHPGFNYDDMINDIAIVCLSRQLTIGDFIKPVALALKDEIIPDGSKGMIAGWGITFPTNFHFSEDLWETSLPIISNEECKRTFGNTINDDVFCAGLLHSGTDAYYGDSGGPLVINDTQYGIISWGIEGDRPLYIGVYTRIAAYRDWIDRTLYLLNCDNNFQ